MKLYGNDEVNSFISKSKETIVQIKEKDTVKDLLTIAKKQQHNQLLVN